MRRINLANILTLGRLFLAPVFVLAYAFVDVWPTALGVRLPITILWVLFVVMELTDVLDGMVARRQGLVTDLGKVLDPFSDVVCRLTYFTVLVVAGTMPLWFLFVVLYRELASVFLRLMFIRSGYALGAGSAGKLKSWFYSVSAAVGLFLFTADRLPQPAARLSNALGAVRIVAIVVYAVAGALAVWSFAGYLRRYIRRRTDGPDS